MVKKFTVTTISLGNIQVADDKEFIALHFAPEGAQGSMCEINALDIKGNLYKFSFNCFAENYIPLETLLTRFFPFLRNWEFVTLNGMEQFKRNIFGNNSRNPEVDCGWVNGYIGCMNHLFIRTDICTHLAETANDLVLIDDRNPLGSWIESLRIAISRGDLDIFSVKKNNRNETFSYSNNRSHHSYSYFYDGNLE